MSSTTNRTGAHPSSSSGPDRIRVVTIDDHPAIRDALADTIEDQMGLELCGQAASGGEAFEVVAGADPHVVVLDISLKDAHGLNLVQDLKAQHEDVQVVIFSMFDEQVYAERAIRSGAAGYVMKSEPTARVVEAIRAVARGEIYLSRKMSSHVLRKVTGAGGSGPGFSIDELTDRELEVFQMLGEGKGVSAIADQLNLSRKTVETYRRRAKEKLDHDSVAALLQHAIRWTHGQEAG